MKTWALNVWHAFAALWLQFWLWLDLGANMALGVKAVILAVLTGKEQAVCWADETLSAHAYRAARAGKPWARIMRPLIDRLYFWQKPDPRVTLGVGRVVRDHCESAFQKKRLLLNLAAEYRDPNFH